MTTSVLPWRAVLLAACVAAGAGPAAQPAYAATSGKAPVTEAAGVKLAGLCQRCAVVTAVRSEKRKGDASGVGAVGGAVVGGVVGKSVTDSTLGTVGGAALGGLAGHEIEKRVKRHSVWATHVVLKDGSKRRFDTEAKPGWRVGQVVEIDADERLRKR